MITVTHDDLHVLDIGPPAWCWARLASTSEATLSFSTPRGRVTLDVRYTVEDEQISIAMSSFDAAGWSAAGRSATVKISGTSQDQLRWSVRATGYVHRAGEHLQSASRGRPGASAVLRPAWLVLHPLEVRGHYETVGLDGLPTPDPVPLPRTGTSGGARAD